MELSTSVKRINDIISKLFQKASRDYAEKELLNNLNTWVQELIKENTKLEKENKRLLDNAQQFEANCKEEKLKDQTLRDNRADNVTTQFIKWFNKVEVSIPGKSNALRPKVQWWTTCNSIYQTSFKHCRKRFIDILTEPLYLLTELNETEYNTSQTDWDRKDELDNVFTAYECLLTYSLQSSSKLGCIDKSIVDNVISSVTDDTNKEVVSQLHDQVRKAVELCWRMQMLPTPMFICQPRVYNDEWHETHRKTWSDNPNDLVYYRPVLMNSAGGTVAYKGFVGNQVCENVDSNSENNPCHILNNGKNGLETEKKENCDGIFYFDDNKQKLTKIPNSIDKGVIRSIIQCEYCERPALHLSHLKFFGDKIKFLHVDCFQELKE